MDDELKAIQDDLDDVLERLEGYLKSDKAPYDAWPGTEWEATEELASAVYCYVASQRRRIRLGSHPTSENDSLLGAIRMTRITHKQDADAYAQQHSKTEKETLLAALSTLVDRHVTAVPLSRHTTRGLSDAAKRFTELKVDKYFGEYGGQDLLRHKGKGAINRNQELIEMALVNVYALCRSHPEVYTLRRVTNKTNVFDYVASLFNYGVKPGTLETHWQNSRWREILREERTKK